MAQTIKWLRVAAIAAFLGCTAIAWFVVPIVVSVYKANVEDAASPTIASDDEQQKILRTLIETIKDEDISPLPHPGGDHEVGSQQKKPLFLFDRSVVICGTAGRGSRGEECSKEVDDSALALVDNRIPKALIRDLVAGNARAYAMPDPGSGTVVMAKRKDIEEVLTTGGWKRFYELFQHSGGFLSATRTVLSPDGTHALIYVEYGCGAVCGSGRLYYMTRKDSSWKIEQSYRIWDS